jgi:tRNA/tmRNA/rRNA uracil-C5-methylase (TrmA/RlmC/RlmD family)
MSVRFAENVQQLLAVEPPRPLAEGECRDERSRRCGLCLASQVDYERELTAKQTALLSFWSLHRLPEPAPKLIPGQPGRDYRFTSRRRCFMEDSGLQLAMVELEEGRRLRPFSPLWCRLEPAMHRSIYGLLGKEMRGTRYPRLREALLHVVLKGLDDSPGVVFSLAGLDPHILREANRLSKVLTRRFPMLTGVWIHRHSGGKGYALGSAAGASGGNLRKLYGRDELRIESPCGSLRFSPLCFSQVHPGMIGPLLRSAEELLPKSESARLLDLYCGYGLFALNLHRGYRQVLGLEGSMDSVRWAQENARRLRLAQLHFRRLDIQPESLAATLPMATPTEDLILDPPRPGPSPGVIPVLAARRPRRVLHICCDIERIPIEMRQWADQGYRLAAARALDMFPGVPAVESLLLFLPD